MKVVQTEVSGTLDILFNLDPYTARPIMVDNDGIVADATTGKKTVKAGSLLDKDGKIKNDNTVRYVLLHDVDVTYGKVAGAGVYRGTLNKTKIETHTGVTIDSTAEVALEGVVFMTDVNTEYVVG